MKNIGARLKLAREKLGLTQKELAERLDLKPHQIRDLESGKTKFSRVIGIAIQTVVGISTHWLLTGEGPMFLEEGQETPQRKDPLADLPRDVWAITKMLLDMPEEDRKEIYARVQEKKQIKEMKRKLEELEKNAKVG